MIASKNNLIICNDQDESSQRIAIIPLYIILQSDDLLITKHILHFLARNGGIIGKKINYQFRVGYSEPAVWAVGRGLILCGFICQLPPQGYSFKDIKKFVDVAGQATDDLRIKLLGELVAIQLKAWPYMKLSQLIARSHFFIAG